MCHGPSGRGNVTTLQLAARFATEPDKRLLLKFLVNFGWKGARAVRRFERRAARGVTFPAFLFLSLTDACNLACRGCWVSRGTPARRMDADTVHGIIDAAKREGVYFYGLMGGEPLLYENLLEVMARHPDCYFQLFTNGTLLTDAFAAELRRLGNVTPLVSIEGAGEAGDRRRGGSQVYDRALAALDHCRRHRLITGVATSVCRDNLETLATEAFARELVRRGVLYLWYYIYRPVGPDPAPELALSSEQVLRLRRFIVALRLRVPLVVVDAYWDSEGRALCPAATGIGYHINAAGDVEPCPPVQFADSAVRDGRGVLEAVGGSGFLAAFRELARDTTRGCVLMERPDLLRDTAIRGGARDTSGRGTAVDELAAMPLRCSHHLPGEEIPERHLLYRFAKRRWFFGFGAYG